MTKLYKAITKIQAERSREVGPGKESAETSAEDKNGLPSIEKLSAGTDLVFVNSTAPKVEIDFAALRDVGLFPPVDQQRQVADQFRVIKRPLIENVTGKGAYRAEDANLIMVSSPLPGDGKTFTSINLALSMALERDRSILLIDADVAKPHISRQFGIDERFGLVDLLANPDSSLEDAILPTGTSGLWLLPAGSANDHAAELLSSRRMTTLLQSLAGLNSNWIVIFDSPPLLVTSEAGILAKQMGQVVLVVCSGKTPQDAVIDATASFDPAKPVSVVLNNSSHGSRGEYYVGYGARSYPYGERESGNADGGE